MVLSSCEFSSDTKSFNNRIICFQFFFHSRNRIKHQKTREFNGFTPIIRNYGLAEGKHISGDGWAYNFPKFTDLNNAGHPPDENFVGVPNLEEAFRLLGEEAEAKDGVFYKPHFIYPAGREKINELERLHL